MSRHLDSTRTRLPATRRRGASLSPRFSPGHLRWFIPATGSRPCGVHVTPEVSMATRLGKPFVATARVGGRRRHPRWCSVLRHRGGEEMRNGLSPRSQRRHPRVVHPSDRPSPLRRREITPLAIRATCGFACGKPARNSQAWQSNRCIGSAVTSVIHLCYGDALWDVALPTRGGTAAGLRDAARAGRRPPTGRLTGPRSPVPRSRHPPHTRGWPGRRGNGHRRFASAITTTGLMGRCGR